jgi:hypothetical protein
MACDVVVAVPWSHFRFSPAAGIDAPVTVDLSREALQRLAPHRPGVQLGIAEQRTC